MRRLWAWLTNPKTWIYDPKPLTPDVIAVPAESELAERVDAVKLRALSYLDEQARQWPEDRNGQAMDLAADVLLILGVRQSGPGEVPVIPGRTS